MAGIDTTYGFACPLVLRSLCLCAAGAIHLARPWLPTAIGSIAVATIVAYVFLRQFYAVFLLAYGSTVVVITVRALTLLQQNSCITLEAVRVSLFIE